VAAVALGASALSAWRFGGQWDCIDRATSQLHSLLSEFYFSTYINKYKCG